MWPSRRGLALALLPVLSLALPGRAQVIEFESNGLRYQTLTKNSMTVMFAQLPQGIREYTIVQIAVFNGSGLPWTVRPEDVGFERADGSRLQPVPPRAVVSELIDKGSRGDVIRLVTAYEAGLYGMSRGRSTSGYEQRRQSALAEVNSTKLKAAAAASAIALVTTKLAPGESTDGAVFWDNGGKSLGSGKLTVRTGGETFTFDAYTMAP